MPRHMGPRRPPSRPGQTRGGRRGQIEAFERQAEGGGLATATRDAAAGPREVPSAVSVSDLAGLLGVSPNQIIKVLLTNGIIATINQVLDYDTAAIVAADLGFDVKEQEDAGSVVAPTEEPSSADGAQVEVATPVQPQEDPALLRPRPPVVTIMGHVDHGKTSLLDATRQTQVASGEAGGITQHIGAYQVEVNGQKITFLDTPGHEAFTAMRARGTQVTDIVVIVVAADDGVMPQTREAIDHARAAGVPVIVAINKIDRPDAQVEKVKQQLADLGVVVTDFGGPTEAIGVSARTHEGLDTLLETILLVADAEVHPRANPARPAEGAVIEAKMDKQRGAIATFLVQRGTLRVGDMVVAGSNSGRIKALFDDHGQRVKEGAPSFPVEVLGLTAVPSAGDHFQVVTDERAARQIAEQASRAGHREGETDLSVEAVFARVRSGSMKELNLIMKADVQGSVEPIVNSLEKLGDPAETRAKVIHAGLGNVNVSDVNLAVASKALLIAFNVRVEADARRAAELNKVTINEYTVIYTLLEDIERLLIGMVEPRFEEVVHGHAEVRQTFKSGKRTIAGCVVADGVVQRNDQARLKRAGQQLWQGPLGSLKRFKDDVAEVREGFECGIALEGWDDIAEGDVIELYANTRV